MEIALSAVEECIVWTNSLGQIKWCNGPFERLLGQPRLFLLGTLLSDKLPLWQKQQLVHQSNHPVELALVTKKSGKQDYEFQQSNQFLILEIAWSFVEIANTLGADDAKSAVLVLRDVTQQRYAAQRQQEINELLEQQVAQRTQALHATNARLQQETERLQQLLVELQATQARLVHAEKMSSLGQLVAGIAHEINNPVNFIHGNLIPLENYANNLLELIHLYQNHYPNPTSEITLASQEIDLEFLQQDLPKLLDSMTLGADRIRQIVLSLRNFSRMDEAKFKLVDIHEGIDSTLLILQHRLKAGPNHSAMKVIRDFGNLPLIECCPGELNQVFMNILSNAIDALEVLDLPQPHLPQPHLPQTHLTYQPNQGCITIHTSMIDSQWIKIVISDNGPGMTAQVQQKIFDPFFTTKSLGKGTGMGMSISYQIIVEKHRGKLDCLSKVGQGTEFIIAIPTTRLEF
ncbi:MAG: diguanylate cyclase [Cyanothece sp. SIO2G6]|nr:diguanylate cyclase [Cyanothece sp. SIO2G6]